MRPDEARPEVLSLYCRYRKQGYTPLIAMQLVRSASRGIAEAEGTTRNRILDIDLPRSLTAAAAMQVFVASQYIKTIRKNTQTDRIGPYWTSGFMSKEGLADWELNLLNYHTHGNPPQECINPKCKFMEEPQGLVHGPRIAP